MQIQLFLNHAGFDDSPPLAGVHFKHTIQVLRHIDDHRVSNGLSRQACPAASRKNRNFEVARNFHCGKNVLVGAGNDHADRFDLVNAGIGAVHQPRGTVEANFALHAFLQRLVKIFIHISTGTGAGTHAPVPGV